MFPESWEYPRGYINLLALFALLLPLGYYFFLPNSTDKFCLKGFIYLLTSYHQENIKISKLFVTTFPSNAFPSSRYNPRQSSSRHVYVYMCVCKRGIPSTRSTYPKENHSCNLYCNPGKKKKNMPLALFRITETFHFSHTTHKPQNDANKETRGEWVGRKRRGEAWSCYQWWGECWLRRWFGGYQRIHWTTLRRKRVGEGGGNGVNGGKGERGMAGTPRVSVGREAGSAEERGIGGSRIRKLVDTKKGVHLLSRIFSLFVNI